MSSLLENIGFDSLQELLDRYYLTIRDSIESSRTVRTIIMEKMMPILGLEERKITTHRLTLSPSQRLFPMP